MKKKQKKTENRWNHALAFNFFITWSLKAFKMPWKAELRIRIFFTIGIRDKFFPDPGSFWPWFQLRLRICSRKHTGKKKTVSLHSTFHIGSGMRKCSDPGKNNPDPQHWIWLKFSNQNHNLHTLRYRFFGFFWCKLHAPAISLQTYL
jgi:hypothetical protein